MAALSDTKVMNISFVDSAGNCVLTEYDKEKKVNKTEDDSLVVRIANACTAKTADLTIKSKSKYVTCDGQAAGAYAGAFQVNPAKKAYVDCLLVYGKEQELKIRLVAVKGSELGLEVEP